LNPDPETLFVIFDGADPIQIQGFDGKNLKNPVCDPDQGPY
jgi:hypothetical protein